MPQIRPVSDLRNHFAEITREIQTNNEPLFFTKNGFGAFVVMSMESYENGRYESEIYDKLREAEIQARTSNIRYSHSEVMETARAKLMEATGVSD